LKAQSHASARAGWTRSRVNDWEACKLRPVELARRNRSQARRDCAEGAGASTAASAAATSADSQLSLALRNGRVGFDAVIWSLNPVFRNPFHDLAA
jgi:hypothetical protein